MFGELIMAYYKYDIDAGGHQKQQMQLRGPIERVELERSLARYRGICGDKWD